jgi:hypothetical protein
MPQKSDAFGERIRGIKGEVNLKDIFSWGKKTFGVFSSYRVFEYR